MSAVKISPGVYWVGAIDWNLRFCGSYTTPRGTTYNAYLIMDKKVALVDSVKKGFEYEMLVRIRELIDPQQIDYVICQHTEPDHAGALPELMRHARGAKLITTQVGKDNLLAHFGCHWDAEIVKQEDALNLGEKTLTFIEAKMLHWPDNMFTYIKEEGLLLSSDAFGQHIATNARYEDEVGPAVMEEAVKYFAVIVSTYSAIVREKIRELEEMRLGLKMIAPAHGVVWRQPKKIIDCYKKWSSTDSERKATVVFDTMWQSTERMAQEIARGIAHHGVEVCVFNLRTSDWSVVIKDIMDSRLLVVGSPTLNMGMYPTVGGFLTFLKGIKPSNKKAASFGSYGWGKGAVKAINNQLQDMRFEVLDSLELRYVPDNKGLERCFEFGKRLVKKI